MRHLPQRRLQGSQARWSCLDQLLSLAPRQHAIGRWLPVLAVPGGVLVYLVCLLAPLLVKASPLQTGGALPSSTADHLAAESWWPTQSVALPDAYVGSKACAECHVEESRSQPASAMGLAAVRAPSAPGTKTPAQVTLQSYSYSLKPQGAGVGLQVTAGSLSSVADIAWVMGANVHGETYLLQKGIALYESQVSGFSSIHGLALTPGHQPAAPGRLEAALGLHLSPGETAKCFGCHTTASSVDGKLDLANAVPGIQCEGCHGPGRAHVAAMTAPTNDSAGHIFSPSDLKPGASIEFCGACHRTTMDVLVEENVSGIGSIRFQPYRLQKSRCWEATESARLTCVACHDPHKPLVHNASGYDQQCLGCHQVRGASIAQVHQSTVAGPACPKAVANCTSCHMPKYDVAEMHAKFTDHDIRIVQPGEAYPR